MIKPFLAILLIALLASCNNASKETEKKAIDSTGSATDNVKTLSSPADTLSEEPYLFSDKNGMVYLSWIEKKMGKTVLKFSMMYEKKWMESQVISTGDNWFVNWADYPLLASDGDNNLAAHFLEKSEKGTYTYDVKLVTSADNGKTWSSAKILHDDGKKAEHGFVSMVPYKNNFFISWLDGRNAVIEKKGHHGQMTLRAALTDKKGNKLSEWELDNRVCDCCQTSAAITTNGPIVVYRDRSQEEIRDISIVRLINGKWTTPKPIFPDEWKIEGCPVNGPKADAQGNNVALAWFSSPNKKSEVKIIFSKDGGASFGNPIKIDEGNAIGRVDVVMLDEKSAMISWMEGSMIKAARVFINGNKETSIIIASSSESRSSGFPQMAKWGNDLIFAWTDDKEKTIKVTKLSL